MFSIGTVGGCLILRSSFQVEPCHNAVMCVRPIRCYRKMTVAPQESLFHCLRGVMSTPYSFHTFHTSRQACAKIGNDSCDSTNRFSLRGRYETKVLAICLVVYFVINLQWQNIATWLRMFRAPSVSTVATDSMFRWHDVCWNIHHQIQTF